MSFKKIKPRQNLKFSGVPCAVIRSAKSHIVLWLSECWVKFDSRIKVILCPIHRITGTSLIARILSAKMICKVDYLPTARTKFMMPVRVRSQLTLIFLCRFCIFTYLKALKTCLRAGFKININDRDNFIIFFYKLDKYQDYVYLNVQQNNS